METLASPIRRVERLGPLKICRLNHRMQMISDTVNQQTQDAAHALVDDHAEVDELINKLLAALDQENNVQSFELLDLLWARLAMHIRAEHVCLFPSILHAPLVNFTGSGGTPKYEEAKSAIDQLRHDHDFFMRELGTAINAMRQPETHSDHGAVRNRLGDVRHSVIEVKSRLDTHNQLEENYVYKWVNVMLGVTQRATLMTCIRHELENIPPRFNV